tara:strand:+ start:545 stop:1273 length:729 start_codon:yes stop_codon:yes gene_type:complete
MLSFLHSVQEWLGIPMPLVFALTASTMALLGILLAVFNRRLALRAGGLLEIFSGCLLVGVTLTHLMRHALEVDPVKGAVLMMLGGLIVTSIGQLGGHLTSDDPEAGDANASARLASVIAIGVHSLLDGGVYVASLDHGHDAAHAGAAVGFGLILHEASEGAIVFFLCQGLFRRLSIAAAVAFLAAAATTPLGTIATLWAGGVIGPQFLQFAFPLAAGFVGCAGAALLWPHLRLLFKRVSGVG